MKEGENGTRMNADERGLGLEDKKVYFAGPLFSDAEKEFNLKICGLIEEKGFEVFLPQRDGIELSKSSNNMSKDEKRIAIFNLDRNKVIESDVFLFVLDGRAPDEGACVELGIAYSCKYFGKEKILIGLHTDSRSAFIGSKLNSMLRVPLDFIFDNVEDFLNYLERLTDE